MESKEEVRPLIEYKLGKGNLSNSENLYPNFTIKINN
jgi:hypothetical protein